MNIGPAEMAVIWAGASGVGTALFWSVLLLGRLTARLERNEVRVDDLDHRMDSASERMSDLTGKVQTLMWHDGPKP